MQRPLYHFGATKMLILEKAMQRPLFDFKGTIKGLIFLLKELKIEKIIHCGSSRASAKLSDILQAWQDIIHIRSKHTTKATQ